MKNGRQVAREYLELGLNPVPVSENKEPLREKHSTVPIEIEEIEDYDFDNIGISTGSISGGLEAIDFDLKNAADPDGIMKAFKSKVSKKLLKKLTIQKTISGGYHMIYRCEDISSSRKLAKNEEGKAVIETRGEGGYIKCYPSKGYELIQGDFSTIPIISPEERLQLFISAKMLNSLLIKEANKKRSSEENEYIKKFPEYNENIEIGIKLLTDHGWTIHSEDSVWVNFSRPDSKSKDLHAGYHKDGKFFFCFSTAQDVFETEKPYNNHAIFAELECGGNYKKAYAILYEEGYGDGENKIASKEEIEEEDWKTKLENLTFLSDEVEENSYLEQARRDEVQQGLVTGWSSLDEYFRFKDHSFNMGLGFDGVGKSVAALSLAMSSNVLHDWKWGMIMPENRTAMSRRRLVEIKSGKTIKEFKDSPELFDKYVNEIRQDFKIISNKRHYSILDVIEMGKRLYEYYGINALLIDPYNFFKVEGNGYSHNNEILSQLRVFAEQYCSVYVMAHPRSDSPRSSKGGDGYLKAPSRYDIQGGADFPYRVDDFFIFHRIVNHPDSDVRRTLQFIVEKIKEEETGGKRHNAGEWTELIWERRDGFLGYWDDSGNNPMYNAMVSKLGVRARTKRLTAEEAFL